MWTVISLNPDQFPLCIVMLMALDCVSDLHGAGNESFSLAGFEFAYEHLA